MPAVIEVETAATRRRRRRLVRYVESTLLRDEGFVCPSYAECRDSLRPGHEFREGTMSHVGRRYDLRVDGRPLRIVVVGQEAGWPRGPGRERLARRVTVEDRHHLVHDLAGLGLAYSRDDEHLARSPHMRGTTSVLRVLLGLGLGSEHGEELVRPAHGRPFHLFDGFALVNRLLCSASRPESNTGAPTRSMWENCSTHFAATLSILQPTVVVSQGLSVSTWVQRTLFPSRWHGEHLYESLSDAGPVAVCLFSHPSARGAMGWGGRLDAPYLTSVVVPTLVRARHLS